MTDDDVQLRLAGPQDAPAMLGIIHEAFGARRELATPPEALSDTVDDVRARIADSGGIIATVAGRDAACLLMSTPAPDTLMVHRVSVLPGFQHAGLAALIVRAAGEWAAEQGLHRLQLMARTDLPEVIGWWRSHGFSTDHEVPGGLILSIELPTAVTVPTAEDMRRLGALLARRLRAGDLLVANGELGAGKTTLAQGIGAGLDVDGPVISPTFVLSRVHRARGTGPDLVHVDAYRMGSAAELEDIDLDASMADSVTLVEWGAGMAEQLAPDRLDIDIVRSADPADDTRTIYLTGHGDRWTGENLHGLRDELAVSAEAQETR
ncbi:tRNA (adenosine(37)-N6)-threonylcarbamoyltransferase complex ATPase subunit type 1 TsaE [Propionibacterium australiense]|uniref:tRNA threonylcarbamoyladenosine biosynthesis protein TsaE n=1 Tax=Propionibacterium australiense TaxID=119981 RepID=A0A8B3FPB8_9ACTN|nr:tRNA (adenosine(37)-N6)-threonylcarbamoyltransferase complex ATPase subunit type 1 TsaE [Propionibacterium australiense]RLP06405.1 tRNA (adenosine(37)-N6)-threonylcarbamoyltransferase complex ATPase subunit type 1 TsaE [Propionibacterium australiense]